MKPIIDDRMPLTLWTIGHSTHSFDEFVQLLQCTGIKRIVDVRSVPRSSHVPHFNREELSERLPAAAGIEYIHMNDLGGWRKPVPGSPNTGWRSAGFRAYADYLQSGQFQKAASELIALAQERPTAIMCAEAVPFKCHRSIISDYLTVQGIDVRHIYPDGSAKPHQLTDFAVVRAGQITYPPAQSQLDLD